MRNMKKIIGILIIFLSLNSFTVFAQPSVGEPGFGDPIDPILELLPPLIPNPIIPPFTLIPQEPPPQTVPIPVPAIPPVVVPRPIQYNPNSDAITEPLDAQKKVEALEDRIIDLQPIGLLCCCLILVVVIFFFTIFIILQKKSRKDENKA